MVLRGLRRFDSRIVRFVVVGLVLALSLGAEDPPPDRDAVETCLSRVRDVHGGTGPWAVAGYRIGQKALSEFGLPRHSFRLLVIHHAPAEVQYSCVADGLQAATGTSPGKLNLKLVEAPAADLATVIEDRETGRTLTFRLRPELVRSIRDLPHDRLEEEGRRVAGLPDTALFVMTSENHPEKPKR